jgi:hypothetical protein
MIAEFTILKDKFKTFIDNIGRKDIKGNSVKQEVTLEIISNHRALPVMINN